MIRTQTAAFAALVLAAGTIASAQVTTFYSTSFEGTDAGWAGTGDWQRGAPSTYVPSGSSGAGGIPTAADGSELWATILDGPHNNMNPSGSSVLSQTFDFSGISGPITLSFDQYLQSGSNSFDMATVQANGTQVALFDGTEGTFDGTTVTFAPASVDLSAFAGQSSVDLAFDFFASTVVNRDGWYIDSVALSGVVPEPTSIAALGLAGLATLRRRRA